MAQTTIMLYRTLVPASANNPKIPTGFSTRRRMPHNTLASRSAAPTTTTRGRRHTIPSIIRIRISSSRRCRRTAIWPDSMAAQPDRLAGPDHSPSLVQISTADGSGAVSLSGTFPVGPAFAPGRHAGQSQQPDSGLEAKRLSEPDGRPVHDGTDGDGHDHGGRPDLGCSVCASAGKH